MTGLILFVKHVIQTIWRAFCIYIETDGEQRAASFAYYALFALFPLIIVFVTIGSQFVDQNKAARDIIEFVREYIPVGPDGQNVVTNTVRGVIESRRRVSILASVAVLWSSLGFFHALVRGVNRAWGTLEYPWWKLPIKNLAMLGIVASALFIGTVVPLLVQAIESFMWNSNIPFGAQMLYAILHTARLLVPSVVLFYGLSMFYKFAPRQHPQFSSIWVAALVATILLQVFQKLFVLYATRFSSFNAVYGALASVAALLLWIYLSGSIIIFGGCLSAAQNKVFSPPATPPQPESGQPVAGL